LRAQKKERAAAPPYNAAAQDVAAKDGKTTAEILRQGGLNVNGSEARERQLDVEGDSLVMDYSEDDVSIVNKVADEEELSIHDNFYFTIYPTEGIELGLTLNLDQIRVLRQMFDDYLLAFELNRRLVKKRHVKARKNFNNKEGV